MADWTDEERNNNLYNQHEKNMNENLNGTPKYVGSINNIIDSARKDAEIYSRSKVAGVLVENMHDIPYMRSSDLGPETVAFMTRICTEIRQILPSSMPCGVQILAGANREAIATAQAAHLQFVRCEGFVFSHVADEGIIDACAGQLLRYRKQIDAEQIHIFTDIKKKHSAHAVTADVSIQETAHAAEFFLSDGIIVTGAATGDPADIGQVKDVKRSSALPILVGSGVNKNNLKNYVGHANGAIIGSHFKEEGRWQNMVSEERVQSFMTELDNLGMDKERQNKAESL